MPRNFISILKLKKTTLLPVKTVFKTAQEKNSGAATGEVEALDFTDR